MLTNRKGLFDEGDNTQQKIEYMKKVIATSREIKKGILDDDYTLFDDGEILHEYDRNIYPGGFNLTEKLTADELTPDVKARLLSTAADEDKETVKNLLKM